MQVVSAALSALSFCFTVLCAQNAPPQAAQNPAELAPPVLQEKFDQPSDNWPQTDKCYMTKGKYYVNEECFAQVGKYVWENFDLTVVATFYTGGQRTEKQVNLGSTAEVQLPTAGILFRNSQNGYYRLSVAPLTGGKEGVYKLVKLAGGREIELSSWRRDLVITMRNEIRLRCQGEKFELWINALKVADFKDADLNSGAISLFFSGGMGSFDDLVIKQLKP